MTDKQRIGLRQIRALKLGETIWDVAVAGFGARRQRSNAVSYVLFYRTKEGRQRWFTIGRHGAPRGRLTVHGTRRGVFWAKSPTVRILPATSKRYAKHTPFASCATSTLRMPKPGA